MNNEIKEILNYLAFLEDIDTQKKVKKVADYITNLEECHKNMFDINLENDKLIWDLQNENEKLKDTLNKIMASDGEKTTPVLDLIKEKEDYKSRSQKAIEYINEHETRYNNNYYFEDFTSTNELLDILNGRSDE